MRVLFVGGYKSPEFLRWDGKVNEGLGGLRKLPAILRALVMAGHEVRVISSAVSVESSFRIQPRTETVVEFPEGQVKTVHVATTSLKPWGGLWACIATRREALKTAVEWQPDVVCAYNGLLAESMSLTAIHKRMGTPLVVEVEDVAGVRSRGMNPKPLLDRLGWKTLKDRIAGFILINKSLVQILECGIRPWMLLPGVVDEQLVRLASARSLPFSGVTRRVIYTGGLSSDRGADRLLASLEFLPPGWQLVVSGAGPLAVDFKKAEEKDPNRCRSLGFVPLAEMYREMTTADVTINTPEKLTEQGGVFPFKMFEYIASGTHIISPKLPDVGGPSLKFFQRWDGSPTQLGGLLQRAESDYNAESKERNAARDWVLSNFDLPGISRNIDQLLKSVVKNRPTAVR